MTSKTYWKLNPEADIHHLVEPGDNYTGFYVVQVADWEKIGEVSAPPQYDPLSYMMFSPAIADMDVGSVTYYDTLEQAKCAAEDLYTLTSGPEQMIPSGIVERLKRNPGQVSP